MLSYKNEKAETMLYISGRYRLVGSSASSFRSARSSANSACCLLPTSAPSLLECIESGTVLSVSYRQVEQLLRPESRIWIHFLRLASARLFQNIIGAGGAVWWNVRRRPSRRPGWHEFRRSEVVGFLHATVRSSRTSSVTTMIRNPELPAGIFPT